MISAKEAKQWADRYASKELDRIYRMISDAALEGKYSVYGEGNLQESTKRELEKLGYKVETGSQFNDLYFMISWGEEEMKAITIWQPWAGAVAEGIKENETRSWYTKYRGPIAIHAAQQLIQAGWMRYTNIEAKEVIARRMELPEIFNGPSIFPSGVILATAELLDCIKITKEYIATLTDDERVLGDYTLGRYAWKLGNVRKLPEPIPARGRQGLWDWEKVEEKMNEEL